MHCCCWTPQDIRALLKFMVMIRTQDQQARGQFHPAQACWQMTFHLARKTNALRPLWPDAAPPRAARDARRQECDDMVSSFSLTNLQSYNNGNVKLNSCWLRFKS